MRFLKKRGHRLNIDENYIEAYTSEEKAYIKEVMEEDTRDALVKEYLMIWLLIHHPEVLGFKKSLRESIVSLQEGDEVELPAYTMEGSLVSGIFTVEGSFNLASSLLFHVRIVDPLEATDGSVYFVNDSVTLIVRSTTQQD